jgi:hypothetical protein
MKAAVCGSTSAVNKAWDFASSTTRVPRLTEFCAVCASPACTNQHGLRRTHSAGGQRGYFQAGWVWRSARRSNRASTHTSHMRIQ